MKRTLLYLIIIIFVSSCEKIANGTEYYSGKFKWKIKIPSNFEKISIEELNNWKDDGESTLKKNGYISADSTTFLFGFKINEYNSITGKYTSFNPKTHPYEDTFKEFKNIMYKNYYKISEGREIDTLSREEIIGGKEFNVFETKIDVENGIELINLWYSTLINNTDFTISISYIEKDKGLAMIDALKKSKFE